MRGGDSLDQLVSKSHYTVRPVAESGEAPLPNWLGFPAKETCSTHCRGGACMSEGSTEATQRVRV